jgi:hypothetical protein
MATISRNTFIKRTFDHILAGVPIVPNQAINQGDMVMWDVALNAGNGGLRVVATQADMATYMGVASQASPMASLGDTYSSIEILRGDIVRMHTTAAEVYKQFAKVWFNETVDAQTIVLSTNAGARTIAAGYIIIPQQATMTGVTSITGAAGVDIQVWIAPNYPVATI